MGLVIDTSWCQYSVKTIHMNEAQLKPLEWKSALAREQAPVRVATSVGALVVAWIFGALFLDGGGLSAVSALAGPAAIAATWLAVGSARDNGPRNQTLLLFLIGIVHPFAVFIIAIGASMASGGSRTLADLCWMATVSLSIYTLAKWHYERNTANERQPTLRRITGLGIVLLMLGQILLHMPELLRDELSIEHSWLGLGIGIADSAIILTIAIATLCAISSMTAKSGPSLPLRWLGILAILWVWATGWTATIGTGLVLPALAVSAAVMLSPLFAPRLSSGEPVEYGTVAFGVYVLAAAWLAAIANPGNIPETVGAPASSVAIVRYGLIALFAYQLRDLIVWGIIVRLAPREHWTGALWIIWFAVSWVIGGEGLRTLGVGWAGASFLGVPWGLFIELPDNASEIITIMALVSLLSAIVAVGTYIYIVLRVRRTR